MPQYEYRCQKCSKSFTVTESIERHTQGRHHCPKCKSTVVEQVLSGFFAKTSKKS